MTQNRCHTLNEAGLPLFKGRANKTAIIVPIIADEMKPDGTYDAKRVFIIATKRMEQYTSEEREGVNLVDNDVQRTAYVQRRKLGLRPEAKEKSKKRPPKSKSIAPTPISYSLSELMLTKEYIEACGDGDRALALINLVAALKG